MMNVLLYCFFYQFSADKLWVLLIGIGYECILFFLRVVIIVLELLIDMCVNFRDRIIWCGFFTTYLSEKLGMK